MKCPTCGHESPKPLCAMNGCLESSDLGSKLCLGHFTEFLETKEEARAQGGETVDERIDSFLVRRGVTP